MYGPEVNVDDREDHGSNHTGESNIPQDGLLGYSESADIPSRFIKPAANVNEAVAGTRFVDRNELNNILALDAWLCRWGVTLGQVKLLKTCNGLRSIGGFSVAQMLQAHTQIITGEGLGVPTGKKSAKDLDEVKRHRERRDKSGSSEDDKEDR